MRSQIDLQVLPHFESLGRSCDASVQASSAGAGRMLKRQSQLANWLLNRHSTETELGRAAFVIPSLLTLTINLKRASISPRSRPMQRVPLQQPGATVAL